MHDPMPNESFRAAHAAVRAMIAQHPGGDLVHGASKHAVIAGPSHATRGGLGGGRIRRARGWAVLRDGRTERRAPVAHVRRGRAR